MFVDILIKWCVIKTPKERILSEEYNFIGKEHMLKKYLIW